MDSIKVLHSLRGTMVKFEKLERKLILSRPIHAGAIQRLKFFSQLKFAVDTLKNFQKLRRNFITKLYLLALLIKFRADSKHKISNQKFAQPNSCFG